MRSSLLALVLFGVSLGAQAHAVAAVSRASTSPYTPVICTTAADCSNGICGSDHLCGFVNGAACVGSDQCRSVCAPDGRCGVPAARYCQNNPQCRGNLCNADGACGVLMGATCTEADVCRSGVCAKGTCVPFCSADADCQAGVTYCATTTTTLCAKVLQNGSPCDRDTMCEAGVCGADGLCGATSQTACSLSAQCRSGACEAGACSTTCASDANCTTGTYCNATTQLCETVFGAGTPCTRGAQCDGGACANDNLCGALSGATCLNPHTCRSNTCAPTFVCADICTTDSACDYLHYCGGTAGSAVCTPRALTGEACSLNSQCINGTCNEQGVCGQLNGGACADANSCVGGACQPQDLRCGLVAGQACTSSAGCRVGYCNAAGVCASCKENADCPMGLCDSGTGACSVDPNYLGVGLEGGGCAQSGRTGIGMVLAIAALCVGCGMLQRRRRSATLWALLLGIGLCGPAQGAGFALQRYVPTDPGQMQLRVDKPWYAQDHARLDIGLVLDVGHNPLVYKTFFSNAGAANTVIIANQLNAVVQAAFSWTSWLTVSAHIPFVLVETGHAVYNIAPQSGALGTAQVNATFRLVGQADTSPISLHVALALRIPEGVGSHAHDSGIGVVPRLIATGRPVANFSYAASLGVWVRPNTQLIDDTQFIAGNQVGTELQLGLALSYVDDHLHFSVGPEFNFGTVLSRGPGGTAANSSLEMLLGGMQNFTPHWGGGVAVGMGLFGLSGTPDWRIIARLNFTPFGAPAQAQAAIEDRDHDGVADAEDACPDTPGTANSDARLNGCPPDRDGDGIADADDACPTVPAGLHPDPSRPGCPMPEHAKRAPSAPKPEAERAAVSAAEPQSEARPYQMASGGADDDFAPSYQQPYVPEAAEPQAAPASVTPPAAQSEMPPVEALASPGPDAAAQMPEPDVTRAAEAPLDAAPKGPAPTSSVAHPPAATSVAAPPVALHNHKLSLKAPITFVGRTAKLSADGQKQVMSVAHFLVLHKELKHVSIEVYTDNEGRAKTNKALAQKRANAIKQGLIKHHVPARKLRAYGAGDAHPVASNKTPAGRMKNMRVEFSVK